MRPALAAAAVSIAALMRVGLPESMGVDRALQFGRASSHGRTDAAERFLIIVVARALDEDGWCCVEPPVGLTSVRTRCRHC